MSESDLYEGIWKLPFLLVPLLVAAAVGSLVFLLIRDFALGIPAGAGVPGWLTALSWTISLLLLPLMFISALETGNSGRLSVVQR